MKPVLVLKEGFEITSAYKSNPAPAKPSEPHCVLIATIDLETRAALIDLLKSANVETICVSSVKDIKALMARKKVAACFCGFWLQDGTYREVIRHLRRERLDIPAIIISAPTCPQEFGDYLAALNLGGLDVLSYPYQQADFERLLEFAIPSRSASSREMIVDATTQIEVRGAA
jgi:DNA-binding NtrC family response regulator